jgi:membrane-associated phospholipid phosphatase
LVKTLNALTTLKSDFQIQLPRLCTIQNRLAAGVGIFGFAVLLYLLANHIHYFPPQTLPLTWIDQSVPFLPNTFWIYTSEYIYFFIIYYRLKNELNLNRYLYSIGALQVTSCLIFCIWPTTYPRDLFPLPTDLNQITYSLFNFLRVLDTPANCCPSLHVSSVYLACFVFRHEQSKSFYAFFTWATLIAISTLTTKQHYLADVISGLAMALAHYWFFYQKVSYRMGLQANR